MFWGQFIGSITGTAWCHTMGWQLWPPQWLPASFLTPFLRLQTGLQSIGVKSSYLLTWNWSPYWNVQLREVCFFFPFPLSQHPRVCLLKQSHWAFISRILIVHFLDIRCFSYENANCLPLTPYFSQFQSPIFNDIYFKVL